MALPFIVGGAMLSGIANALSGSSERKKRRKTISKAQDLLREGYISNRDIGLQGNRINRYFNAAATNVLNSTALSTRGVANAPVVAAAAAAPLAGQSALAQANYKERADQSNKSITEKIAIMELQKSEESGTNFGDFFSGAIQGGIAGSQIASMMPKSDDVLGQTTTAESYKGTGVDPRSLPHNQPDFIQDEEFMTQLPKAEVPYIRLPSTFSRNTIAPKTKSLDLPEPMKDNFRETEATGNWETNPINKKSNFFDNNILFGKGFLSKIIPEISFGYGDNKQEFDVYHNSEAENYFNRVIDSAWKGTKKSFMELSPGYQLYKAGRSIYDDFLGGR